MKRQLKWAVINFTILGIFLLGEIHQITILTWIALILLWFTAIGGTIIGLLNYFFTEKLLGTMQLEKYKVDGEIVQLTYKKKDTNTSKEYNIQIKYSNLVKMASPSIPIALDMAYDLIVSYVLFSYDYEWLTMFYLIHILGLYITRKVSFELKDTIDYLREKDREDNAYIKNL